MNTVAVIASSFLSMLLAVLPKIGVDSTAVTSIISFLSSVLPILIQEAQDVLPLVRNIIDQLQSETMTDDQRDELNALSKQVDDAYYAVVGDYLQNHPDTDSESA